MFGNFIIVIPLRLHVNGIHPSVPFSACTCVLALVQEARGYLSSLCRSRA